MPYNLSEFRDRGLYIEASSGSENIDTDAGKVLTKLPDRIKNQLNSVGGDEYDGDRSRQDSAVISAMLNQGSSPADTYATFIASPRGRDAAERKSGHLHDYVHRTIAKAYSFVHKNGNNNGHVKVDFGGKRELKDGEGVLLTKASDVELESVRWLWKGYIPAGKLTIIAGDPEMGKSTIALDLICRITKGTFMPLSDRTPAGTCLVCSGEDAAGDTIVPRLTAAGADLKKVSLVREVKTEEGVIEYFSLPRHLEYLRDILKKTGARLLVIDPLNAFLGRDTDTHKDQDIRSVLSPLEALAEETNTSIVIVSHLNKRDSDTQILYRVGGSIGLVGAARSVLGVAAIDKAGKVRVLFPIKSSLSKRPPAIAYEIQHAKVERKADEKHERTVHTSRIKWREQVEFDPSSKSALGLEKAERDSERVLREILQEAGTMQSDDVFKEAAAQGLHRTQLRRARINLNIKVAKKQGKWYWSWPEETS